MNEATNRHAKKTRIPSPMMARVLRRKKYHVLRNWSTLGFGRCRFRPASAPVGELSCMLRTEANELLAETTG